MADNISMKQVPAGTVTATDDRILYDCLANGSCGVLYGCEIAYTGNNMIHINAGYGIIKGGLFEIEDHTEYVDYAESGVVKGQIYLHFDAAADDKLIIVKETTDQAHILEQDINANYDSGVYEIQLCTFNATPTTLENVTQTFPVINGSVLDSLEEIMANTAPGLAAGALAVKSLNNNLQASDGLAFKFATDGAGNYGFLKADDSFVPFSNLKKYIDVGWYLDHIVSCTGTIYGGTNVMDVELPTGTHTVTIINITANAYTDGMMLYGVDYHGNETFICQQAYIMNWMKDIDCSPYTTLRIRGITNYGCNVHMRWKD